MANPVGRPRMYTDVEEMEAAIDKYFQHCKETEGLNPTMSGMALALGFVDRHGLSEYAKRDEFSTTIKRARARIEANLENHLYGAHVTGTIFNLKNNFGWKDKQEHGFTDADGNDVPAFTVNLVKGK